MICLFGNKEWLISKDLRILLQISNLLLPQSFPHLTGYYDLGV